MLLDLFESYCDKPTKDIDFWAFHFVKRNNYKDNKNAK